MRVLHVAPCYRDAWAYGGIPRIVHPLAEGLARRGHGVTVCTTDALDDSRRLPANGQGTGSGGGAVDVRVFRNLSNSLAYHAQCFLPRGLGAFLQAHTSEFDLVHLHLHRNLPVMQAAWAASRARVPYVLAPNGTAVNIERRRGVKAAVDLLVGRRTLTGASRLIAVSAAERRQFETLGIAPGRVRIVPNPVDLAEFDPPVARGQFRERLGLADAPLVVTLGKFTPRKRVDVLLAAFARMRAPESRLVIAGSDMGGLGSLGRMIGALGLAGRVMMCGVLRGRERLEALADADVVAYAGEHEVFGLVALEAVLCGTPVVVADDSGSGEILAAIGGGRAVPPGDAAALADALDEILRNKAVWRAAAGEAAPRARQRFGSDQICAQLEAVYEEVISETRPSRTFGTGGT